MDLKEARWPLGIATVLGAWYASDSLRHRREHGNGYTLHGNEGLDVGSVDTTVWVNKESSAQFT